MFTGCADRLGKNCREEQLAINVSRRTVSAAFFGLAVMAQSGGALANVSAPTGGDRVVLNGYDPVSYFTEGRPAKGSPDFTASFEDATYWFKNAENQRLFDEDPERFAPQFGGWCAIAMARREIDNPDPEAWVIVDGKLYVFGRKIGPQRFAEQQADNVEKATRNWRELSKKQ